VGACMRFLIKALASLPLPLLYALGSVLRWLAFDVGGYRRKVIHDNIAGCYPELDPQRQRALAQEFSRRFVAVLMEILKETTLSKEALQARVEIKNPELIMQAFDAGSPVIAVAAHHGNWEWMLLALSMKFPHPVEAAYKPLHDAWAEQLMLETRTRFGANMFPAKTLLPKVLSGGRKPRVIALVADQEPVTAERRQWLRFMGRDTAFYMGLGELARATRFPVFFCGMQRTRRGHYAVTFTPLTKAGETVDANTVVQRYAAEVEAQVRADPASWLWSNRRWKLKKPLYG